MITTKQIDEIIDVVLDYIDELGILEDDPHWDNVAIFDRDKLINRIKDTLGGK